MIQLFMGQGGISVRRQTHTAGRSATARYMYGG